MTGPLPISWTQLALAATVLVADGLLSMMLGLGLGRKLFIAAIRSVVQLTLLGAILGPVFTGGSQGLVLGMGGLMIVLAAREAVTRTNRTYSGIWWVALASVFFSAGTTTVLATAVAVQVEPWWQPQYLIPLLGMILGNSLTGISLGLDRLMELFVDRKDELELLLARGATWWEASQELVTAATRAALIPILNAMSAVGLVTIPGMMTGQILGGTDPALAARYQILILFLIAGATALGSGISVVASSRLLFDDQHRLRLDRLEVRRRQR